MILNNNLKQFTINPFKISIFLNKENKKQFKINFSLLLKIVFFKFFLKKNKLITKTNIFKNIIKFEQNKLKFNLNLFSIKKNLNHLLKNTIFPISNAFFLSNKLLEKFYNYQKIAFTLKKKYLKLRKKNYKKSLKLKKKVYLKIISYVIKLKESLLLLKNRKVNFFLKNNHATLNLFLILKKKF